MLLFYFPNELLKSIPSPTNTFQIDVYSDFQFVEAASLPPIPICLGFLLELPSWWEEAHIYSHADNDFQLFLACWSCMYTMLCLMGHFCLYYHFDLDIIFPQS